MRSTGSSVVRRVPRTLVNPTVCQSVKERELGKPSIIPPAAIIRIPVFNFMHNTLPPLFLRLDWLRVHGLSHYLTSASLSLLREKPSMKTVRGDDVNETSSSCT